MKFDFTLRGQMPLLMNHRNIEFADELAAWIADPANAGKSKPGDDRTPSWSWHGKVYSDGAKVVMPQDVIMSCLKEAGKKIKAGRGTLKRASQSSLLIDSEFCKFVGERGEITLASYQEFRGEPFAAQAEMVKALGFGLSVKSARIPGKTTSQIRVRPRFEEWAAHGVIEILDTDLVTPDQLAMLFDIAGKQIGLGDWRPGAPMSPGPYGRFLAELRKSKTR